MSSQRLLVTVECETGRREVALPGDIPIARLVPQLIDICGGATGPDADETAHWVVRRDGHLLPGNLTLEQAGVDEGAVLSLHNAGPAAETVPVTPPAVAYETPEVPQPPRPGQVALPKQAQLPERLRKMGEAVISSAWRSSDYTSRLADVIAAPRLARCVTIAVVSPKGGVGKTTTAALLGSLFAMIRSDRVVAVDSNPDHGTLGRSLTAEHAVFVDDLLEVIDQPALTVTMLERFLGRGAHGLLVLPSPTDFERMERLGHDAYERVVHRLQELAGIVILDCGAGLTHPATRAALEAADQLVMVSDADPLTASVVVEAAQRLRDERSYTVVVNKLPRSGGRLDLVELAGELTPARGVIRIGAESEAAARVADGSFRWETAPEGWQLAFRELAAVLAADWQQLDLIA